MSTPRSIAALIPVKNFDVGKSRLASALEPSARSALARRLATNVLQACAPVAPHVVCEDPEVAAWARGLGAEVIQPPGSGLNRVVRYGVAVLNDKGFERVLVAHADIAEPAALADLAELDGVVLVPDDALDGTNALLVPADAGFRFSYGPNSFARHLSEAERLGMAIHVVRDPGLALDLDDPDDYEAYQARQAAHGAPDTAD